MKKFIILLFIICTIPSFLFSKSSNISYNKTSTNDNIDFINVKREKDFIEIEIDFSRLPYQIVYNEKNEVSILMQQLGKNTNAGEPELPKTIFRVGMLPNVKRESIKLKILQQDITDLGAGYNITPVEAPKPALDGWNDQNYLNEGFKSGRDLSIYNRDNLFPYSPIIISPLSNIKDWIFVSIELWPFQYNPQKSTLKRIDYIKCRIDFELDKTNMKQYNTDDFLKNKFHEPWKGSYKNSLPRDGNGYVIITTNDIISNSYNINRFIECEEHCGYSVSVITEDDYGSLTGQPPDGTAEKIRQWLIENYLSLNIQYVLLIGDPDPDDPTDPNDHIGDIPMKMLYPRVGNGHYWSSYSSPSDYFYADLTGNWNHDGDDLFGEQRSSSEPVTPDPQIEENTFSIRWTGKINVTDQDGIRIAAYYDDGIKMWIDDLSGEPVINDWSDHLAGNDRYDILTPGLHDIKIEYYQNTSNSFFRLLKGPVGASWFSTIRGSELYYWDGSSYQQGGLNGEYYNDINITDYAFSRIDPNSSSDFFDFKWFSGDRGDGGVDFSPEVSVGRIPVYDNDYSQLDEILYKLTSYQYSPDTSWRTGVLLPMKPFDGNTPNYQLGEQVITELCEPNDFDYYRIYDEDYGCTPPPEATPCTQDNVLTAWQNPFALVTWATHGSSSGASSVLYSSSCPQLDDDKPAFVFQGSCNNGYPEDSNNLGYSLLKNGAVATVSASRVSWYGVGTSYVNPGDLYIHGFCYYYSKYVIENNSAGESINLVKNVSANSTSDTKWMNIFDFNLYGNPALTLTCSPCEDSIPPTTPILSLPSNTSTISGNNPTLIWQSSIDTLSGVDYYILQYADNQDFIDAISKNITDTTCMLINPLVNTTYYWKVKAVDLINNESSWSTIWGFIINTPPVINFPNNFKFNEDDSLSCNFTEYILDVNNPMEDLTLSWSGNSNIQIELNSWIITFSSSIENWNGPEDLTFYVNDGIDCISETITVYCISLNDSPYVLNPLLDFSFEEDTINSSINLNEVFDDVDLIYGDYLTFSNTGNNNIGVDIIEGIVTLTPEPDWFGSEMITFTATDDSAALSYDELEITIDNVNDAPTIDLPESFSFVEDSELIEDISSYINDVDEDSLEITVEGCTNTHATINGTFVTFSSDENWNGSEILTFTINDNKCKAIASDYIEVIVASKIFYINQNYPNPFNQLTTIYFNLPEPCNVEIQIFNIKGNLVDFVECGHQNFGINSFVWNARDMSSGIYFYKIIAGDYRKTQKCILIK